MDSAELSRKVAEAMGWRECAYVEGFWMPPGEPDCFKGSHHCYAQRPPDLADAMDREAVIAWLNAEPRKYVVLIHYGEIVAVEIRAPGYVAIGRCAAPTIEEAFGQAVLAAIGGEQ